MLSRAVLETIVNDKSSTDVEKAEALSALRSMDGVANEIEPSPSQDAELELWLLPDKRSTASERITVRAALSPASQRLLDDISDGLLVVPVSFLMRHHLMDQFVREDKTGKR
jgi:hypothetical protein